MVFKFVNNMPVTLFHKDKQDSVLFLNLFQ